MTENSDARFETLLLFVAFFIAGLIWPARDLVDPPLSFSRKRSKTSPPASGVAAQGEEAGVRCKSESKKGPEDAV